MKQQIDLTEPLVTDSVRRFILTWREKKQYPKRDFLTLGECIELLVATTYNLHQEESDGRFFNRILVNQESIIAWDGEELIDILFYEAQEAIKNRLKNSRHFTS